MKHTVKVIGTLVMVAFYCIAIHVIIGFSYNSDQESFSHADQETYFSGTSIKLYSYLPESGQRTISGVNLLPVPSPKSPLFAFVGIIPRIEQALATEFSQYTSFSINLLIHYRKSDLIFPFHYFW